jgi:hypothetical protein
MNDPKTAGALAQKNGWPLLLAAKRNKIKATVTTANPTLHKVLRNCAGLSDGICSITCKVSRRRKANCHGFVKFSPPVLAFFADGSGLCKSPEKVKAGSDLRINRVNGVQAAGGCNNW